MLKKIKRVSCGALGWICTVLLAAITLLALMQVIGRYILLHTFFWVEEVTALLIGWLVACGVPWIWLEGGHIAVDMIDAALPPQARKAWNMVIQVLAILAGGVIVVSGLGAIRQNTGFSISMLRYDESVRFYWVPFMGAALALSACLVLWELVRQGKGDAV